MLRNRWMLMGCLVIVLDMGWAVDAKSELNKSLKDDVDGALNVANFKDFKDSNLSRPLREWYLRQQEILALLPAKPASASK